MWAGQALHPENVIQMDYSTYPHPPPFTSPPATPMTPHHNTAFAIPQYEQPMVPIHYVNPAPPPPPLSPSPDYRIYTLCQHLRSYPQVPESELKVWWDEFMNEFFHENATLAIEVDFGEGIRKFCLMRQWIVCYFKSMMENGVTAVHVNLGQYISTFHHSMQQLECRNATMEMDVVSPQVAKVCTTGSLILDFSLEEKTRIISWYFNIKDHVEFVPRCTHTTSEETADITCKGILPATRKFLMTASMIESGLQDTLGGLPSSTTGPTDTATTQWQELHPTLEDGSLQAFSTSVTTGSLPPPPVLSSPLLQSRTQPSSTGLQSCSKAKPFRPPCSKKGKTSPTSKMNQFVLVAAEAIPLTAVEDLIFDTLGEDERTITRVDNQHKPVKVKTSDSCHLPTVAEDSAAYTTSLSHPPIWPNDALVEQGTLSAIR